MRTAIRLALFTVLASIATTTARAQSARSPFDSLHFREIGPAATGGRIHDLQVDPKNPAILYVGAATGGIWKSTNNGVTWKDVFGHEPDNTFGSLAIFEGDSKIIWAGSGENNNRQSSSWGGGVYRSTNGGETWSYLGLHDTRCIGRVVLHPTDPNVAYVAACGNLWRGNPERGVYKTTDAGRNWLKVLYVDTLTGATDLVMDPRNPAVLYAATYQRLRRAFGYNGGGPGSALYKTTDAGATWRKMENGIPAGDKGRIGLAIARSNPNVLVATIEHATAGGTYRTEDAGVTWKQMSRTNPRPMYYSKPTIDPNNDRRIWLPGTYIVKSEDGGATFEEEPTSPTYDVGLKTDHHVLRVDPMNSSHIYVVGDGGLHESFDMGKSYIRVNNIPVGQFYRIAVDDRDPYWIYGGLQDNHSWMGPSATRHWLGILNQDWQEIGFSDGTGKAVDKTDWRKVYSSSSGGNLSLVDPLTGDVTPINPRPPAGEPGYRYDWDAPVMASRHTSGTVFLGANRLFISKDFGSTWTRTKDLTRSINRDTLMMMGVVNRDIRLSRNDGDAISEISNIAESPLDPKVLWVGTDDGNVQLSTDGGATWNELSGAIHGVANGTFVGKIVASSASRGTAYVSFDAHRDGDFAPYIFRTTDFGKSWKQVTTGLPGDDASVRGLAEYPGRANVLFAGTERSLFVTHDSGAHWTRLSSGLPTTRYDDILVHPRTKDLVLGTHGRSIWLLDDASPIADWTPAIAEKASHLFAVPRATLMLYWEDVSNMDHYFFTAENPAEGAAFTYHLGKPAQKVQLVVRGPTGKVIRTIAGPGSAGLIHRVNWDLRYPAPPATGRGGGGGGGEEGGGGGGPGSEKPGVIQLPIPSHEIGLRGPHIAPGTFKVTLEVDGVAAESRSFEVRADPALPYTLAQHKAREAFVVEVAELQVKVEALGADLRARRTAASGAEAARLQALETRLLGGGGGRGGGGGGRGGAQAVRAKLGGLANAYTGSGARTGSLAPPTGVMRETLTETKAELAAIEKEIKGDAKPKN
ncbi:MAG: WD40/YVTN/BNR-like repeat-containing protein [Gemmatimonadales bacterium]